jgi:hypothetical protein
VLVAPLALPGLVRAGPADYSPENPDWQGLSKLFRIGAEQGLPLEMRPVLDWSTLRRTDVLLVLYPTAEVSETKLLAFLRAGGRVILADDFGASGPLLERLGVRRVPVRGETVARLHADNPALPIATPGPPHPLNEGIGELVTNHPAAFVTSLPAIFQLAPQDGAVVVAATLGKGRIVLVSDPSLFINRMLAFGGNEAFARRLLDYLGRKGEDRFVVVAQGFEERGTPRPGVTVRTPPDDPVSQILGDTNDLLNEFNDYVLETLWILPLATLLAGVLLALAVWILPMNRPTYDARWTRPGEGPPPSRFERDLTPYLEAGARPNFILPAAVLRDVIDSDLGRVLGIPAPLVGLDEPALARLVEVRAGREGSATLETLLRQVRHLPGREQVSPDTLTPRWSFTELRRLAATGDQLVRQLGGLARTE